MDTLSSQVCSVGKSGDRTIYSPTQLLADRTEPCDWALLVSLNLKAIYWEGKEKNTHPASNTLTNVTLPAVDPRPPAVRIVPALRLDALVTHGFPADSKNSS